MPVDLGEERRQRKAMPTIVQPTQPAIVKKPSCRACRLAFGVGPASGLAGQSDTIEGAS